MSETTAVLCDCTPTWLCKEALRLWMLQAELYEAVSSGQETVSHKYIQAKTRYDNHREGRRFTSQDELKEKYKGYNNREFTRVTREILDPKEDDGTDQ